METQIERFSNKIEKNDNFKVKVIIGHILIAKVFLDIYFEKYYLNFIKDGKFNETDFLKSVWYIDLMFDGDNYTDRYSLFEDNEVSIIEILANSDKIPLTLRQSIIGDLDNIIGKKDKDGNLISAPYSLDFSENEQINQIVKNGINNFLENQLEKLKNILNNMEINGTKDIFLAKIKKVLNQK